MLVAGAAAAATALALGSLFGGVLTESRAAGATAAAAPRLDPETALSGFGRGDGTAETVAKLEAELRSASRDPDRLGLLGLAYQVRWRETGDPSFLPLSEHALRDALRARPKDATATLGLGHLALIRHDFRGALVLGRKARRLAPYNDRPLGVIGDALLELGRYDAAFRAFDRMNELEPTIASYARVAYGRELIGDLTGAIAAMRLAVRAAAGAREPAAWALVELAKLEVQRGRTKDAKRGLRAALTLMPDYVFAEEQLARIEAGEGRLRSAIARARRASEAVPLPQLVSLYADLLARAGREREAHMQIRTVAAIDRLLAAGGIDTDLESVVFDADHLRGVDTLVARARSARAARPSVYGDDALAWALARTGRCGEAKSWSERSLRLGTRDPMLAFHRAFVERCLGNADAARAWARRAVAANPQFSVRWARLALRIAA
jgi:tetratricopeptide (TPR) repeat protein